MKYLKRANLWDDDLKKILSNDEKILKFVSAKIQLEYDSAPQSQQQIILNGADLENEVVSEEASIHASSLQNARPHYLCWMYFFRFSTYQEIESLRQVLLKKKIEELCSDISILWIYVPLWGLVIEKKNAQFGFHILEFKSSYTNETLELLY